MAREDTPGISAARGAQLRRGLEDFQAQYEWIGDVRGMGLMQALELVEDRGTKEPSSGKTKAVLEATKEERLLVGVGGLHGNVIRLGPSMLVTETQVQDALRRLGRALHTVNESG
jgi:4-aminobutyrate aminotransferase-like enzyme